MRAVAQAGRTTLICSPQTAPAWVDADPTRLVRWCRIFSANALKFTPDGVVVVAVEPDADGGRVLLRVRDTGLGLTADELPYLFEPFIQFDAPRERGLGLGLSVARTLVARHGGELTAASDGRGKGAALTVSLPAARVA